jgi:hypothetical protein
MIAVAFKGMSAVAFSRDEAKEQAENDARSGGAPAKGPAAMAGLSVAKKQRRRPYWSLPHPAGLIGGWSSAGAERLGGGIRENG